MKMSQLFRGPIPGQSLTSEPGSKPWERPPEMVDVDDVANFYLERLSDDGRAEDFLMAMEQGMPIANIVKSVLTSGVSKGLHNIDMSLIVAPVLHEHLKGMAEEAGVKYNEGLENKQRKKEREKRKRKFAINKALDRAAQESKMKKEDLVPMDYEIEEEKPKRKGLVKKREK